MATEVVKIIDPDNGSGTDYTSLSAWEAAMQKNLVTADEISIAKCRCTGGTADSTKFTIDGFTTDATRYVKIWTDPAESYRHAGKLTEGNKYRLVSTNGILITVSDCDVWIDGLQLHLSAANNSNQGGIYARSNSPGNLKVSNCIIRGSGGSYSYNDGIQIYTTGGTCVLKSWNNIIYDFTAGSSSGGITVWDSGATAYIYNCTIHNCYRGILRSNGTVTAKNCLTASCSDGFNGTITTSYCATNLAESLAGTGDRNSQTFTFVDEANDDFHLASNDAGALGYGTNLYNDATYPFQDDIDGDDRGGSGASWDIGADEYVAPKAILLSILSRQRNAFHHMIIR